jgi:hypothetical protein
LLLAVIDILVVFNFGRAIAWIVAHSWGYRIASFAALASFTAWAGGYNLLVGHVREALQIDPETAMTAAWQSFVAAPLGLAQADSWVLVAIGLALSVLAMADGLNWDDKYPGYGALHRRLVLARDQLEHWKRSWREGARVLRQSTLDRLDSTSRDAGRDVIALDHTIETKALLLRNIRNFSFHYEESCNALIRVYRDHNLKHRETQAPEYFSRTWKLKLPDRLSDSTETDLVHLREARAAAKRADSAVSDARVRIEGIHESFVQRIETEVAR